MLAGTLFEVFLFVLGHSNLQGLCWKLGDVNQGALEFRHDQGMAQRTSVSRDSNPRLRKGQEEKKISCVL
jgi:hypothetical protein